MKFEKHLEINNLQDLLLLEIHDKVTYNLDRLKRDKEISKIDMDIMRIDKESLDEIIRTIPKSKIAVNLKKKIDYIIKALEE